MPPNHSRFPPIEEKQFLTGSRIPSALKKVGRFYFRNEFRKDAGNLLEELTSTVLSTAAVRSDVGQRLSCFCPETVVGGMTMLLNGLMELVWFRGSTVEASKAEYQSFVRGPEAVGAHLHEASPACKENPVFLVLTIWISGSLSSLPGN